MPACIKAAARAPADLTSRVTVILLLRQRILIAPGVQALTRGVRVRTERLLILLLVLRVA
jgi:hypothetical protein